MAIDLGVVVALMAGGSSLAQLASLLLPKWIWFTAAVPVAIGAAITLVPITYFFLTIAITGRTVGKALIGVRVVRVDGRKLPVVRALLRVVAYIVSVLPLFAGFFWVLVDGERRAWHDHIAGSRVVYERNVRHL